MVSCGDGLQKGVACVQLDHYVFSLKPLSLSLFSPLYVCLDVLSLVLSFQDIYLLRHDGPVEELNFSPCEVEDVKLVPMDQLKEALEAQVHRSILVILP